MPPKYANMLLLLYSIKFQHIECCFLNHTFSPSLVHIYVIIITLEISHRMNYRLESIHNLANFRSCKSAIEDHHAVDA